MGLCASAPDPPSEDESDSLAQQNTATAAAPLPGSQAVGAATTDHAESKQRTAGADTAASSSSDPPPRPVPFPLSAAFNGGQRRSALGTEREAECLLRGGLCWRLVEEPLAGGVVPTGSVVRRTTSARDITLLVNQGSPGLTDSRRSVGELSDSDFDRCEPRASPRTRQRSLTIRQGTRIRRELVYVFVRPRTLVAGQVAPIGVLCWNRIPESLAREWVSDGDGRWLHPASSAATGAFAQATHKPASPRPRTASWASSAPRASPRVLPGPSEEPCWWAQDTSQNPDTCRSTPLHSLQCVVQARHWGEAVESLRATIDMPPPASGAAPSYFGSTTSPRSARHVRVGSRASARSTSRGGPHPESPSLGPVVVSPRVARLGSATSSRRSDSGRPRGTSMDTRWLLGQAMQGTLPWEISDSRSIFHRWNDTHTGGPVMRRQRVDIRRCVSLVWGDGRKALHLEALVAAPAPSHQSPTPVPRPDLSTASDQHTPTAPADTPAGRGLTDAVRQESDAVSQESCAFPSPASCTQFVQLLRRNHERYTRHLPPKGRQLLVELYRRSYPDCTAEQLASSPAPDPWRIMRANRHPVRGGSNSSSSDDKVGAAVSRGAPLVGRRPDAQSGALRQGGMVSTASGDGTQHGSQPPSRTLAPESHTAASGTYVEGAGAAGGGPRSLVRQRVAGDTGGSADRQGTGPRSGGAWRAPPHTLFGSGDLPVRGDGSSDDGRYGDVVPRSDGQAGGDGSLMPEGSWSGDGGGPLSPSVALSSSAQHPPGHTAVGGTDSHPRSALEGPADSPPPARGVSVVVEEEDPPPGEPLLLSPLAFGSPLAPGIHTPGSPPPELELDGGREGSPAGAATSLATTATQHTQHDDSTHRNPALPGGLLSCAPPAVSVPRDCREALRLLGKGDFFELLTVYEEDPLDLRLRAPRSDQDAKPRVERQKVFVFQSQRPHGSQLAVDQTSCNGWLHFNVVRSSHWRRVCRQSLIPPSLYAEDTEEQPERARALPLDALEFAYRGDQGTVFRQAAQDSDGRPETRVFPRRCLTLLATQPPKGWFLQARSAQVALAWLEALRLLARRRVESATGLAQTQTVTPAALEEKSWVLDRDRRGSEDDKDGGHRVYSSSGHGDDGSCGSDGGDLKESVRVSGPVLCCTCAVASLGGGDSGPASRIDQLLCPGCVAKDHEGHDVVPYTLGDIEEFCLECGAECGS